jgi:hypothetical protein
VLRDREYTVRAYLAVLAVRQRLFWRAIRYLGAAARARPERVLTYSYLRLFALLAAHAIGLRLYRWAFWRRPPVFGDLKSDG